MPRVPVVAQLVMMTCVLNFSVSAAYAQDEEPPIGAVPVPEEPMPAIPAEPTPAEPDPKGLLDARAAIDQAQFTAALEALESALNAGNLEPQHLEEVYRLRGETFVAIGKALEAKESFTRLLLLNSKASLGEFASPKIVAVLEAAREELAGQVLGATHLSATESRRVEVDVHTDPLSMVAKLRLSYPRDDATTATLSIPFENGKAVFDVPAQAGSSVSLALLDRNGNLLSVWQVDNLPDSPLVPVVSASTAARPLWTKWWVWAGATGAAATVATAFGIASKSAQSDLDSITANPGEHFFREAKDVEDRAQSRATVANVAFVITGALGITTALVYWQGRSAEATLQVVPAGEGGGVSMILGGRF